jgi:hypothetical protein
LHRSQVHVHRCSIRPSGFQNPFLHVPPQTHSAGAGAGGAGVSAAMLEAAAMTAAAARGDSASTIAGEADSDTSQATSH